MKCRSVKIGLRLIAVFCSFALAGMAQQASTSEPSTASSTNNAVVPRLVNYSGVLTDVNGKPLTGVVGVTFAFYHDSEGGTPLWMEIQNVQPSKGGHYSAMLGSTSSAGLPQDVFVTGEARWLGVQAEGQAEQPRALLVSAPYALKAGDAETIGGLPPSAFVLANHEAASGTTGASAPASANAQKNSVSPANPDVTGKGVVDYIPMWNTTSDIVDSIIFQKSSEIGINTSTPAATLDVNGKTDIRDTLTLFPKSTDSTLAINGTAFKIDQTGKVTFINGQTFPGAGTITGVLTATGSGLSGGGTTGTLNLKVPSAGITNAMLANSTITLNANAAGGITTPGAMTLGSTYTIGLKTCSANQVLEYVSGTWTCSNAGTGTITGVTAGTDLTGGGPAGNVTLNLDTTKVPQLKAANTFTGNQTVTGNLSDAGNITATGLITGQTGSFTGSNTTQILNITQSGTGTGIAATSTSGPAVGGVNTTGGSFFPYGVLGVAQATSGGGVGGIASASSGTTYGVYGTNSSTASGAAGVYGATNAGSYAGTFGQNGALSSAGSNIPGTVGGGVWGDGGNDDQVAGVVGTADEGSAGVFVNNSTSGVETLFVNALNGSTSPFIVQNEANGTFCAVDSNADLNCTGAKHAIVPIDGGARKVALSAIESPKNWFEDAGAAELVNGLAVIALDPDFIQTVNTEMAYMVFPVPNGDCKGLYVSHQTPTSFEVHELGGGTSNVRFYYRIMALRKNYESIRFADYTHDPDPRKQMLRRVKPGKLETKPAIAPVKKSAFVHSAMAQSAGK